jgi:hypothetical protein
MSPELVAGLAGTALDDDSMGIAWNLPSILKPKLVSVKPMLASHIQSPNEREEICGCCWPSWLALSCTYSTDIDENNSRGGVLVMFDCLHGHIRPLLFLPLHQVGTVFFLSMYIFSPNKSGSHLKVYEDGCF